LRRQAFFAQQEKRWELGCCGLRYDRLLLLRKSGALNAFIFDKLLSALRRFCEAKFTGAFKLAGRACFWKQGVIGSDPDKLHQFGVWQNLS